jgi:uncharacterized repeat protein (TIGR01451 family)
MRPIRRLPPRPGRAQRRSSSRRVPAKLMTAVLITAGTSVAAPGLTDPAAAVTATYGPGTSTFVVPAGVTSLTATVIGGRGGSQTGAAGGEGGGGAVVPDVLSPVTAGQSFTIHVGSAGGNGSEELTPGSAGASPFAPGGGGGAGDSFSVYNAGGGGGGGGASAILQGTTPLIVAGGGGGGGGRGRLAGPSVQAGDGGDAGSNGSPAPESPPPAGAGGTCCSTSTRNGGAGTTASATLTAPGGGGGGGGGYDGGTNGGGLGGGAGGQTIGLGGGGGGGGAGGRSWRDGARYTPTSFNTTGNGSVEITYQINTTTTLTSNLNPSIEGQAVTFTATVASQGAGTPDGTVTFFDGSTPISGPVALVNGVATFTTSALSAGSHPITAVYSGSPDFVTSTSNVVTQVVIARAPSLQLVASADPVAVGAAGETIEYTFTVTNTGNVTINNIGISDVPAPPAGPVQSVVCTPGTIAPGGVSTCTADYTVTSADIASASGEILHTFTATGTDAIVGGPVASNPFAVSVDVRTPQPGFTANLVNTDNTLGVTP